MEWYSQGEQNGNAGMAVNYVANICPGSGLDGAQCVFAINLQDQQWQPEFDNWAQATLVDSNANTVASNTQNQNSSLNFSYADVYGNITAQVIWGNSDGLIFSFVLRCCTPTGFNPSKGPIYIPKSEIVNSRLTPKGDPSVSTLSQYASVMVSSLGNSQFQSIPVAFCFDATQALSQVQVSVFALNEDTNMEMYVCPDTLPSKCVPMNAPYFDTSASGYLNLNMQFQQSQYGPFTIVLKCLGQFATPCQFAINSRMAPGSLVLKQE